MSRAFCYQCHRAQVACLCARIKKQHNPIKLVVLQHPDEVSNSKGSAIIAELGLQQYQCWVAEDFSRHKPLQRLLDRDADQIAVLYPSGSSVELSEQWVKANKTIKQIIVIDATWRKAKRIWELCPELHQLVVLRLATGATSNYRIRKIPDKTYLSTVECIVEGFRVLEERPEAYQSLLNLFSEMIDFQIGKMGKATWQKNYTEK